MGRWTIKKIECRDVLDLLLYRGNEVRPIAADLIDAAGLTARSGLVPSVHEFEDVFVVCLRHGTVFSPASLVRSRAASSAFIVRQARSKVLVCTPISAAASSWGSPL